MTAFHELKDVAALLGVSKEFLEKQAREGKLPHLAVSNGHRMTRRMSDEHIAEYVAQNTKGPTKGKRGRSRGQPVVS